MSNFLFKEARDGLNKQLNHCHQKKRVQCCFVPPTLKAGRPPAIHRRIAQGKDKQNKVQLIRTKERKRAHKQINFSKRQSNKLSNASKLMLNSTRTAQLKKGEGERTTRKDNRRDEAGQVAAQCIILEKLGTVGMSKWLTRLGKSWH